MEGSYDDHDLVCRDPCAEYFLNSAPHVGFANQILGQPLGGQVLQLPQPGSESKRGLPVVVAGEIVFEPPLPVRLVSVSPAA